MVTTQRGLPYPDRPFPKSLRFTGETLNSLEFPKFVQGKANVDMLRPKGLLAYREGAPIQRLRLHVPAEDVIDFAQVAQSLCQRGVLRPKNPTLHCHYLLKGCLGIFVSARFRADGT